MRGARSSTPRMSITSATPATAGQAQHLAHLVRPEISAGALQSWRRRDAGRREHDDAQRQSACRRDRPAQAVETRHVADLVRIPADRRGALRHHHLGITARRHHRALDMQMRIDQPRRDDLPRQRDRFTRIVARSARMHAGDQRSDQPNIGRVQFARRHIGHHAAGQQHVESVPPTRRTHRAVAQRRIMQIVRLRHCRDIRRSTRPPPG